MDKPLNWIFGFGVVAWLVWALVGSTPYVKLERGCSPIAWMGRVAVTVSGLASPGTEAATAEMMDSVDSGCQKVLWTLFYGADYNEKKRSQAVTDIYKEAMEAERSYQRRPQGDRLEPQRRPAEPEQNFYQGGQQNSGRYSYGQ